MRCQHSALRPRPCTEVDGLSLPHVLRLQVLIPHDHRVHPAGQKGATAADVVGQVDGGASGSGEEHLDSVLAAAEDGGRGGHDAQGGGGVSAGELNV